MCKTAFQIACTAVALGLCWVVVVAWDQPDPRQPAPATPQGFDL